MYAASKQSKEIHKLDAQKSPVTVSLNVDSMDLSFLLCSSGMYVHMCVCTYLHNETILHVH